MPDKNNMCEPCSKGWIQLERDTLVTKCVECKLLGDVYADQPGQSVCQKCPAGTQKKTQEPHESGDADSIYICECIAGASPWHPLWFNDH
jgi:hypothetical protein